MSKLLWGGDKFYKIKWDELLENDRGWSGNRYFKLGVREDFFLKPEWQGTKHTKMWGESILSFTTSIFKGPEASRNMYLQKSQQRILQGEARGAGGGKALSHPWLRSLDFMLRSIGSQWRVFSREVVVSDYFINIILEALSRKIEDRGTRKGMGILVRVYCGTQGMKDKGWTIREESTWSLVCEMNKHFAWWCRLLRCWRRGGAFLWCAKFEMLPIIFSGDVQQAPECTHRAQLRTCAKSQRIDPECIRIQIPPSSFHCHKSSLCFCLFSLLCGRHCILHIFSHLILSSALWNVSLHLHLKTNESQTWTVYPKLNR